MLVGEAPGTVEDRNGRPFTGPAGKLLDHLLARADITEPVYITNVVKCRPPTNRVPLRPELDACRDYLKEEIHAVRPEIIIALGNTALAALTGSGGITDRRGERLTLHERFEYVAPVVATFHPAYALRNPSASEVIIDDFVAAVSGARARHAGATVTVCTTVAEIREALFALRDAKEPVAYDIETPNQLQPYQADASITMVGLAIDDATAYVVPIHHAESPWPPEARRELLTIIAQLLARKRGIAHNAKFERAWFRALTGVDLRVEADTMLLSHYLDERRPANLADVSRRLFGAPAYKRDQEYTTTTPLMPFAVYCAWDCLYTRRVYTSWQALTMDRPYVRFVHETALAVGAMEQAGIRLDLAKTAAVGAALAEEQRQLADRLGTTVNLASPTQVSAWLQGLGVKLGVVTEKGHLSVSEAALLPVRKDPNVAIYRQWRELEQLRRFAKAWPEHTAYDGRIHASYFPLTETGRHKCSNPNIQQVPRRPELRACFVPSEGNVLVSWDASQVELRMAAEITGDEAMGAAFRAGRDLHRLTASLVAGIPYEAVTAEQRQQAKAINFGFLFEMGVGKFLVMALLNYGVEFTPAEAAAGRKRYFETYPALLQWHADVERSLLVTPELVSIFGRHRRLDEALSSDYATRSHAVRSGINFLVQSPAADITHAALIALMRYWPEVTPVASLHDSVIFEAPADRADDIAHSLMPVALQVLGDYFRWEPAVPFTAEWKIGGCWQ